MSEKREARIQRQNEKALKQKGRSIRLAAEVAEQEVRSEYAKEPVRVVRTGANPGSIFQMTMRWTIGEADRDGAWTWGVHRDWGDEVWASDLHPKLEQFAKLTWAEIESQIYGNEGKRHRAHHSMETESVCEEAQDRLLQLARDFPDTLFRFRLGNLPRLWGVRVVDEFQVVWFDPTHQIFPVG